jgi:hypothetical protein
VKRRRNAQLDGWLQSINESAWIDCPGGLTAREKKKDPPPNQWAVGSKKRRSEISFLLPTAH